MPNCKRYNSIVHRDTCLDECKYGRGNGCSYEISKIIENDCVCKSDKTYHFGKVEYLGRDNNEEDIISNGYIKFAEKELGIHMHKYMDYMGYSNWKDEKITIAFCPFCGGKL